MAAVTVACVGPNESLEWEAYCHDMRISCDCVQGQPAMQLLVLVPSLWYRLAQHQVR